MRWTVLMLLSGFGCAPVDKGGGARDGGVGADESAMADSMARTEVVPMPPNGAHMPGSEPPSEAQPLFESEIQVEGHRWRQTNDFEHRDATFEEIFHLLQA